MKKILVSLACLAVFFVSYADNAGQPSGPGQVHPRFAAAEYGLNPEAATALKVKKKAEMANRARTIMDLFIM